MDDRFRRQAGWVLPPALVERLRPHSISGGAFGPDGTLYLSPHHSEELYLARLPDHGYELEWTGTVEVPFQGQGFAIDPYQPSRFWGMRRDSREVICIEIQAE